MITPYSEVNRLLTALLENEQTILGDQLVGFYLYGSLSLGDFDPLSSDVDFLVVTADELGSDALTALRAMHQQIAASGLPYATRLEGSYIPRAAIRRYDPEQARHPSIGVDWEFGVNQHGSIWIVERHIVREHGVVVWGASPKELIDPVATGDLQAAVCAALRDFWQAQLNGADWLRPRDYQAFAVLTMCRALYTLHQGDVITKPNAATWARQTLDPRWHPLIDRALIWRQQHAVDDDLTETLEFIRFAVRQGRDLCQQ